MSELDQLKQEVDILRKQVAYLIGQGPATSAMLLSIFDSLPDLLANAKKTKAVEEQSALTHKFVELLREQGLVAQQAIAMQRGFAVDSDGELSHHHGPAPEPSV